MSVTAPAGRIRLAVLGAGGALAALRWGSLLADPPTLRLLGVVAVAVALGWVLGRVGPARGWSGPATALLVLAAALTALVVLGLPLHCVPPSGWDRLAGGIDSGLTGLGGTFDYPFAGAGSWARLLLVVAFVPLIVAAAALTFRPGRDRRRVPVAGLVALLLAFAVPAVARPVGAPVLWGAALLVLVVAWLWGERLRALPAIALVAAAGAVAAPVASGLAAGEPPIDYRDWTLPAPERPVTFDWSHTYGPIDWQRDGTLLFRVRTDRPGYWRTEALDEFYGDRWRRSGGGGERLPIPDRRRWEQQATFRIIDLESPLLISPGIPLRVDGIDGTERDPDGTVHADADPITKGTRYSVAAYAPDPHPADLRAASRRYRPSLGDYTELALPDRATLESIVAPVHVQVPVWGSDRGRAEARRRLAGSAYAQIADLAERLTDRAPSAYDAAVAVVNHLRTGYLYDEGPPRHRLPLRAFLFRDKRGYCQQFSGAMALMLRMVGIPARVATGFAAGTPLTDGHGFEVTDLDAHSWVDVYFNGIGWVPFDPTPPTAPATPEIRGGAAFGIGASGFGGKGGGKGDAKEGRNRPTAAAVDSGGDGPAIPPAGLIAVLSAVALVAPVRSLRHRRLPAAEAELREVAELRRVLRSTGWSRGSATLLVVEGRLRAARHGPAAAYVRRFRDRLYGAGESPAPTLAERRRMRRDLASGGGLEARLRLLALMPPGGPRARRRSAWTRP